MFTNEAPPVRAGDYSRFLATPATALPPSTGDVVCVPVVDDWGPVGVFRLAQNLGEYTKIFGAPAPGAAPSPGYIAAYNAFKGAGGSGATVEPGAGSILAYRLANGAAKATKNLAAGATNPALTLTAKYEGARGNRIGYEVIPNAANPVTQVDVNFYLDALLVDQYRGYTSAQVTTLQDDINRKSIYVDASGAVNGTLLSVVALTTLTGGTSGEVLTPADWSDFMTASESQRFGTLVPYDLTDDSIRTSLIAWAKALNDATLPGSKAKPFELVVSGAMDEAYSAAAARTAAADTEHLVNWHLPRVHDTQLDLDLSGSQQAPRIAGLLAHRGGRSGYTFAVMSDWEIVNGPSDFEVLSSLSDGVMTATLGVAGVQVEAGITALISDTPDKPKETFGKLKYVMTMKDFVRRLREKNENGQVIGKLSINKDTREGLVGDARTLLDVFVQDKQVQPGTTVGVAADPVPSDDDDFVALDWIGKFARELRQVRNSFFLS